MDELYRGKMKSGLRGLIVGMALTPFVIAKLLNASPAMNPEARIQEALLNGATVTVQVNNSQTGLGIPNAFVDADHISDPQYDREAYTDQNGLATLTDIYTYVSPDETHIPEGFHLNHNYPNPFNPHTTLQYTLDRNADVKLVVYNMKGQKVKTLANGQFLAGQHNIIWDGTDEFGQQVADGLYFAAMQADGQYVNTEKMLKIDGYVPEAGGGSPRFMPKAAAGTTGGETYTITASHPDFADESRTVTIDGDTTIVYQLTPNPVGNITIGDVKGLDLKALLADAEVNINGLTDLTDAFGTFEIAGLDEGTYRMTVTKDGYLIHSRDVNIENIDTTFVSTDWLFPSDTTSVNHRNGTIFQNHGDGGGYSQRWPGTTPEERPTLYMNIDNVTEQVQNRIVYYATHDSLKTATWGFLDYEDSDINRITTSQRPAFGTEGTIIYDNLGGGNYFAIWENPSQLGEIVAAAASMISNASDYVVLPEVWGTYTGVGDFNRYASLFNDPNYTTEPLGDDMLVIKYQYKREAGTENGADGQQDIEPTGGLGKATMAGTKIYYDGAMIGIDDGSGKVIEELLPQHLDSYKKFREQDMTRMPDRFYILD